MTRRFRCCQVLILIFTAINFVLARLGKRKFASMILEKGDQQKKAKQDGNVGYFREPTWSASTAF